MGIEETEIEPGCYIDGRWGQYAYRRIVEIAVKYGYPPSEDWFDSTINDDAVVEESDKALAWLNANVAKPGFLWGWQDGEVFYQTVEWWEND